MQKVLTVLLLLFLFSSNVFAGEFLGLVPGVSQKDDAVTLLGQPSITDDGGTRYDFNGSAFDADVISIRLYEDGLTIRDIEVHTPLTYSFDKYAEWFDIDLPFSVEYDEGRLIEYYMPQAVALHYAGSSRSDEVMFVTHFDPIRFMDISLLPEVKAYMGVEFDYHKGRGYRVKSVEVESPAEKAGLQPGDMIVRIGNHVFEKKGLNPSSFVAVLSSLPISEQLDISILRQDRSLDLKIELEPIDEDVQRKNEDESYLVCRKAQLLIQNGDPYGARELIEHAIWLNPYEPSFYVVYAEAYYRIGLVDFAIEKLDFANAVQPQTYAFFLKGIIAREKEEIQEAASYFLKSYALNPKDLQPLLYAAECWFDLKDYAKALEYYEKICKKDDTIAIAVFFAGLCAEKLHKNVKSRFYYEQFLSYHSAPQEMLKLASEALKRLDSK